MFFTGSPTKQGLLYKQSESTCSRICALLCSTYSIFKDMIRPCPWEEKKTFVETFKAEDGPRPRHCLAAGSPPTSLPHIMASSPEKICCLVSLWKNSSFITKLASVWCRWKFTHTWKHTVKSKNLKKKKNRQIHQELTLALQLQYMPGSLHLLMLQMTLMSPHKTGLCRVL